MWDKRKQITLKIKRVLKEYLRKDDEQRKVMIIRQQIFNNIFL